MTAKLLGIDYGLERIGLAVADGQAPQRLTTLPNDANAMSQLKRIVSERETSTVVLGLPRDSDGNDTAWTEEVRQFGALLAGTIGVPLIFQDEFASTSEARERLRSQKLAPVQQRSLLDQEAAVLLLEDYLNAV